MAAICTYQPNGHWILDKQKAKANISPVLAVLWGDLLLRLGIGCLFLYYKNYKSEIEWKTLDHQGHVMNEAIRAIR